MAQFCPKCGTTVPDGDAFCRACGEQIDPNAAAATQVTASNAAPGAARSTVETYLAEALGTRYALGGLLGRGGMGAVYRARDTMLDREVAIKVLPPELAHDEGFASRFEREARTAAKLDHPGIIPIYSVEHGQEISFFIMKFVRGRGLDRIVTEDAPLAIDFCQRILWESACALGHAHHRGVIHRDIKPANILLDEDGRVLITDFGIAKASEGTQLTATGQVIGTPHYMSPEQAQGIAVSGASDQYSLAMAGYHMLTGQPPFATESLHAIIYKQIFEAPPSLREGRADVPGHIVEAIERALAKDPAARFPTMEDFATAVWPERPVRPSAAAAARPATGSTTGAPTPVTPTTAPPRPAPAVRRSKAPAVAGMAIVAALSGAGVLWLGTRDRPTEPAVTAPAESTATGVAASPAQSPADDAPTETVRTEPPPTTTVANPPPAETPAPRQAPAAAATPAAAPVMGYLTVNAVPFGRVYVDGVELQDTPVVKHALAPGRHVVEVRREGYRTAVDTIEVAAGGDVRRNLTLVREGGS